MNARRTLTAALLVLSLASGTRAAQVQASTTPSVDFNVLPEGAVWVRPGVFRVPNYNGTGTTLWIEVGGKTIPLLNGWGSLSGVQPVAVKVQPVTATRTPAPKSPDDQAPAATSAPVAAAPVAAAPAPVEAIKAPAAPAAPAAAVAAPAPVSAALAVQTPPARRPVVAIPAPAVPEATVTTAPETDTPERPNVLASGKTAEATSAQTRVLPSTSPVRVALAASDKGVVTGKLPDWVNSQFFIAPGKTDGSLMIGYSLNNADSTLALITDPSKITIRQGDRDLTARLDRRNTSQQVGYLGPKTGEFGTLTVSDASPEPITLTWEMQGTSSEGTYTVSITWGVTTRTVRGQ